MILDECLAPCSAVDRFVQATRCVERQVGCSWDDAIDLMLDRAGRDGCGLGDIAIAVLEGRIRFESRNR